ncbi:type II toxin-antitoxin system death-on-curing family toxin [Priestia megaterium]|uniref:type II toxin-antitoxin system death-on-curing family toxin n=1 Tax=Priestia megaterium TaxID=1404 RepID=UPI003F81A864
MEEIMYLDEQDILDAHKEGFTEFGGLDFGVAEGCVEKRAMEPEGYFGGVELYPGLFRKAAVYMLRITVSHCFSDGNKRAAFLSTDLFLKYNGYRFVVSQKELYDYCLTIADHETRPELEDVEQWIYQNSQPFIVNEDELLDLLD